MTIETRVNKEWSVRLLIIAVAFIGWGFYSVYDGTTGYPNENKLYELTHEFDEETDQWTLLTDEEIEANLTAAGHDPTKIRANKLTYHTPMSINTQFIMAAICFPVGVISIIWLLYHSKRKPRVDEEALRIGGTAIPLGSITVIDKILWDSKGIVTIRHESGVYKLDDWKHRGAKEVLAYIEANAANAKIENDLGDDDDDIETEAETENETETSTA